MGHALSQFILKLCSYLHFRLNIHITQDENTLM